MPRIKSDMETNENGTYRYEELAESEDLDTLWNALYAALEADLSGFKWPKNSQHRLETVANDIEYLMGIAEKGNNENYCI